MINRTDVVVRSSLLRLAIHEPQTARWLLGGGEKEQNDNMLLGSLAHMLLLEPEKVRNVFLVYSGDKRGSDYKNKFINFPEKTLISEEMFSQAREMIEVLRMELENNSNFRPVKLILKDGKKEQDIDYYDEKYKLKMRIKPDAYINGSFMDYKTISMGGVDKEFWLNYCKNYGYDIQLSFYADILEKKGISVKKGAWHLVQSTIKPYLVFVFFFTQESLQNAYIEKTENAIRALDYLIATSDGVIKIEDFNYDEGINYALLKRY